MAVKRWAQNLALMIGVIGLTLVALEVGVRFVWKTAPQAVSSRTTSPIRPGAGSGDADVLRPGAKGYEHYTWFRINALGYRGPDLPERDGLPRVAVVGDSFVYGVGVAEPLTLPGQLERALTAGGLASHVINAGVPGTNLEDGFARIQKVVADYQPAVIIWNISDNDLELPEPRDSGRRPLFLTQPYTYEPQETTLSRLGQSLLPPPSPETAGSPSPWSVRLRYGIANQWKSYQWLALNLQKVGRAFGRDARKIPLLQVESQEVERLIWTRVRERFGALRVLADGLGLLPIVSVYSDLHLEGIPILKLKALAEQSGIRFVDLTPVWGGAEGFAASYTLGWDDHPSAEAHREAAEVLATVLRGTAWSSRQPSLEEVARLGGWDKREAQQRLAAQAMAEKQQDIVAKARGSFSSRLARAEGEPDQWLYGWWPVGKVDDVPGDGRWLSERASVLLQVPRGGGRLLKLVGQRPLGGATTLTVQCGNQPAGDLPLPQGPFEITWESKPPLLAGETVECILTCAGPVQSPRHNQVISAAFSELELTP